MRFRIPSRFFSAKTRQNIPNYISQDRAILAVNMGNTSTLSEKADSRKKRNIFTVGQSKIGDGSNIG